MKTKTKTLLIKLNKASEILTSYFVELSNQNLLFSNEHIIVLLNYFFENLRLYPNDDFTTAINRIINIDYNINDYKKLRDIKFGLYIDKYRDKIPTLNIKQLISLLYCFYNNAIVDKGSLWNILTDTLKQLTKKYK